MPTNDLKTFWPDYPVPLPDAAGAGVTSRGGDPNVDQSGSSGLQPLWDAAPVPTPGGSETANSSGLPTQPSRFEPSGTPPAPPSLKDRSPGTIDER